jgi:hypothetical protein
MTRGDTMQKQCPWCGHCGPRYEQGAEPIGSHDDGSSCVCRHVTCACGLAAWRDGGRYWDHRLRRWICLGGCGVPHDETLMDEMSRWRDQVEDERQD